SWHRNMIVADRQGGGVVPAEPSRGADAASRHRWRGRPRRLRSLWSSATRRRQQCSHRHQWPVETLPIDEWRRLFEVNLFGHIALTQALLPALHLSKGRW